MLNWVTLLDILGKSLWLCLEKRITSYKTYGKRLVILLQQIILSLTVHFLLTLNQLVLLGNGVDHIVLQVNFNFTDNGILYWRDKGRTCKQTSLTFTVVSVNYKNTPCKYLYDAWRFTRGKQVLWRLVPGIDLVFQPKNN